jgi:L-2-hydroxyglutarate oxidase
MRQTFGIVGGGIVGLALAYKLQVKYNGAKVIVFEKEPQIGMHQSGRNSGVLHCGLYYTPGSLKAKLAVSGIHQMTSFCRLHEIPHEICGKVVVASDEREAVILNNLAERGKQNGLKDLAFLSREQLAKREPYVASYKSLLVPEEGIADYKAVMNKLKDLIEEKDGEIILNTEIINCEERTNYITAKSNNKQWNVDLLINCTGLFSDRTFQKFTSLKRPLRIVPFRGEYMMLKPEAEFLVNHLVYPVPDPEYPFLGIHFTRMMNGRREVGPNAVFAFKREGYVNTDFSLRDTIDSLSYKGFLNFLRKNLVFSLSELRREWRE